MRAINFLLVGGLLASGAAQAMDCATTSPQPLRPTVLAPIASELGFMGSPLGSANGVLSQGADESQSVEQVLLRIRIESCQSMAMATPAGGAVNPDDPAAYKPRTKFDNTPWRFNMSQNGKNMTADEFSAWMKSRGVRVARGANAAPVVADPAVPVAASPADANPDLAPQPSTPDTPQQH